MIASFPFDYIFNLHYQLVYVHRTVLCVLKKTFNYLSSFHGFFCYCNLNLNDNSNADFAKMYKYITLVKSLDSTSLIYSTYNACTCITNKC